VNCKNCQNKYSGKFCSNCGQRDIANNRLKFSEIISDFFDNAFNIHKGLFFTFWSLIVSPGNVGKSYIEGQRKIFTNPARYLIIAVAIQAFLDYWFIQPELTQQPDFINFSFLSEKVNTTMAYWNHTLATKYSLIHNLSMILIFPVAFLFLFKRLKYNFTELLTINFYYFSTGLVLTVFTIFTYAHLFENDLKTSFIIGITFSYIIWANMSFFKEVKFWSRLFRIFLAILLFMFIRVFFMIYVLSIIYPIVN
jgi:hypothetical protein